MVTRLNNWAADPANAKFAAWLAKVDAAVTAKVGLGFKDLPDLPYRDLFYAKTSPARAAAMAVAAAF